MKKKSTSQSAFFNLRVLIGLFTFLAGVFLALVGFGVFPAPPASMAQAQQNPTLTRSIYELLPPGFDCSQIYTKGIHRMENLGAGAIMIACGEAQGGSVSLLDTVSQAIQKTLGPLVYGTTDVNLITGAENFPNITQSETMAAANPDNPDHIVVAYNDSRDWGAFIDISAASVSTDGGNTFVRLTTAQGRSPFVNTTGDPVVLYNRSTGWWHTVWIGDGACGGGLGGFRSITPWDANSWTHYCVHSNSFDDRESGWVDNNQASPFYGRMFVSWNDFDTGNADIFVTFSDDNGVTWTTRQVSSGGFFRNVQITGDLGGSGHVYIAGMDENSGNGCSSGCGSNRRNKIYRSTDGGNSWTNTYTGPPFVGPCRSSAGYFCTMYSNPAYWRHMGWGQPTALNGTVHYVYGQDGAGADPGDVYYIRSLDNGVTFSAPFKLNTDTTTRAQWQANLSATTNGSLLAVWYDERETTSCQKGNPAVPCYRMWARKSTDNGATWLADMAFSDVISPLPGQPDPGIITEYAGDYDYPSSVLNQHLHAWTDGRVAINAQSQQSTFFDRDPASPGGTPTPTPTVTPTPGQITLSAQGRVRQGINTVRLDWSGATSNQVDIYRDNVLIVTTANDGRHIDSTGDTGRARYRYRVCEAGTQNCSNIATVTFQDGGTPTPTPAP